MPLVVNGVEKYPEKELGKFKKCNQPYVIAFTFREEGPLVVKGMKNEVVDYIKDLPLCHYKITAWKKKESREQWFVNNDRWTVEQKEGKYIFMLDGQDILCYRFVPKEYIPKLKQELDRSVADLLV